MLVLEALQSWRGGSPFHGWRDDEASAPVERLCWCWSGSRSFHGWRWQLSKAGAVVVPSMAGAMMKQARPLSRGAGGRSFHGWQTALSRGYCQPFKRWIDGNSILKGDYIHVLRINQ